MLKKLLSLFGLGEKEEEQTEKKSYSPGKTPSPKDDDDDEDDDDDDDDDEDDKKKYAGKKQDNKKRKDDDDDDNDDDDDDDNDDDDDFEEELKDLEFSEKEEERMEEGNGQDGTYDPKTLHSLKYTEQQFLDDVERRLELYIKNREVKGKVFTDADVLEMRNEIGRLVFRKWNNGLRIEKFCMAWQERVYNITSFGSAKHDDNNPLLAPIHGVTLQDYAAMANRLAAGADIKALIAALGIEKPVWDEASTLWGQRLQEDSTSTVPSLYMRYMTEGESHPKLGKIGIAPKTAEGEANADRLMNDQLFYIEISSARAAAYDHGYDGTQWMLENYGLDMGDMQKACVKWETERNEDPTHSKHEKMDLYMVEMEEKYAAEFTKEQGGGIADDIQF